jgi:hypothetical protein
MTAIERAMQAVSDHTVEINNQSILKGAAIANRSIIESAMQMIDQAEERYRDAIDARDWDGAERYRLVHLLRKLSLASDAGYLEYKRGTNSE